MQESQMPSNSGMSLVSMQGKYAICICCVNEVFYHVMCTLHADIYHAVLISKTPAVGVLISIMLKGFLHWGSIVLGLSKSVHTCEMFDSSHLKETMAAQA